MAHEDDIDTDIVNQLADDFKKSRTWLPFEMAEIRAVFDAEEIKQVNQFLAEMRAAGEDNARKARLIERSSAIAAKLLKLAKIAV